MGCKIPLDAVAPDVDRKLDGVHLIAYLHYLLHQKKTSKYKIAVVAFNADNVATQKFITFIFNPTKTFK